MKIAYIVTIDTALSIIEETTDNNQKHKNKATFKKHSCRKIVANEADNQMHTYRNLYRIISGCYTCWNWISIEIPMDVFVLGPARARYISRSEKQRELLGLGYYGR